MALCRKWSDITAGAFGIPDKTTHFSWSYDTAERNKPCDGGDKYPLDNDAIRPTARVSNKSIKVYCYELIDIDGAKQFKPVECCKELVGQAAKYYVVVEWADIDKQADEGKLDRVLDSLDKLIGIVSAPSETARELLKEAREEKDALALELEKRGGGFLASFARANPDLAREAVQVCLSLGKNIGAWAARKAQEKSQAPIYLQAEVVSEDEPPTKARRKAKVTRSRSVK